MNFGIEVFSDKTGVVYSGQSDETNLHHILQNVLKSINKYWVLSHSGKMPLEGSNEACTTLGFFLLILMRSVGCPCPFSVSSLQLS